MNKEQKIEVPVKFAQKDLYLFEFIEFYNSLAVSWQKKQLKSMIRKYKLIGCNLLNVYSWHLSIPKKHLHNWKKSIKIPSQVIIMSCISLLGSVDPVIIRLNEGKYMSIVADEGGFPQRHGICACPKKKSTSQSWSRLK